RLDPNDPEILNLLAKTPVDPALGYGRASLYYKKEYSAVILWLATYDPGGFSDQHNHLSGQFGHEFYVPVGGPITTEEFKEVETREINGQTFFALEQVNSVVQNPRDGRV